MEDTLIRLEDADILNGEATVIYGLDLEVKAGDFVYITQKLEKLVMQKISNAMLRSENSHHQAT